VISYFEQKQRQKELKKMLSITLGNFPPQSKAYLKAFCTQKLEFEDLSYCFRLPMTFVPPYMGKKKENNDAMEVNLSP
jgi:hypothetical protein